MADVTDPAADLAGEIIEAATAGDDLGQILAMLCDALGRRGIRLLRAALGLPALDPALRALNFVWWRDRGVVVEEVSHSAEADLAYRASPVAHLIEQGEMTGRWRLDQPNLTPQFAQFRELRARGATEIIYQLVGFGQRRMALEGTALSAVTDRPEGFRAEELAILESLAPALALAAYRVGLGRIVTHTLAAYLGERTARRVLTGTIRRGDGEAVTAAVLLADLRGFSALSEQHPGPAVVGWLNEHFEAMGEPVHEQGGEILKFIGDGILAVFAADATTQTPAMVCASALQAASDAMRQNDALNRRRAGAGGPALALTVALHYGDVFYGNIGTAGRLDFTVIGRVVNEASRMVELCKAIECNLLISQSFAQNCDDRQAIASLGRHSLRSLGERELFTLRE
jgi:adenylate cyclase